MTFESFFIGENSALVEALKDEDQKLIWIAADSGNGKTHLLSSLCNEYDSLDKRIQYLNMDCLLYTSPSPRDRQKSRMPSSA